MHDFLEKARTVHGNKYTYPEKETTWQTKVKISCPLHGDFLQTPAKHIVGKQGCPTCGKLKSKRVNSPSKWTKEQALEKCRAVHGDRYSYSNLIWVNTHTPITITCKLHGNFKQLFYNHVNHKTGCPFCNPSIRSYPNNRKKYIESKLRPGIKVKDIFTTTVTLVCPLHGCFTKSRSNLRNKPGCPKCAFKGYSTQQTLLKDWLESLGIELIQNHRYGDGKKDLDLYIQSHNLAVEIDGIYWHSTASPHNKKLTHKEVIARQLSKKTACTSLNIDLITVLDSECDSQLDAVKNLLGHRLGLLPKTEARKCSLVTLTYTQAQPFFNTYHIQGMTSAAHYYGLMLGDSLVAAASFRHRGTTWEIARYAASHKIVGGFKKLLSHFEKTIQPDRLISFCDTRLFKGSIYESTGFILEKEYKYNYFFVHKGKLYPRETFMRKNLPPETTGLRLREAYKQLGIATLYLPPHRRYAKYYPTSSPRP